jgi:hypothetical protein
MVAAQPVSSLAFLPAVKYEKKMVREHQGL